VSDFILQRRGHVDYRSILPPSEGWDTVLELLESAIERERRLGESVGRIMNVAMSNGDHSTHDFLEPFARQQAQAESELDRIAERLKLVSDAPAGLFMFDEAFA
jgi:ferritin